MRFRPCIDLHMGKVKQIVGGTLDDAGATLRTNFESEYDSAYYARLYRRDNLTGGHVIMLGAGNETAARTALAAWPGGLQIGGGITPENAGSYLDAGAAGVIVTSFFIVDGQIAPPRLAAMRDAVGRDRLILDLSCRKRDGRYRIVYNRWQDFTDTVLDAATLARLGEYGSEFLIHAVDVEGKVAGIDGELVALLAEHSPLPCVYAGGVADYHDVELIRTRGAGRIDFTVGSALDLFGGRLSYRKIVELTNAPALS